MTNEQQTTGDDGKATFQLEYGDYTATITKDGYVTKTENIAFRSNHKNFSITLVEDTPTGTGTVTVTCQDSEDNKLGGVAVAICTSLPPSQSTIVATGETDGTVNVGVAVLEDVPFGSYKLVSDDPNNDLHYVGDLTVDGDENITITLSEWDNGTVEVLGIQGADDVPIENATVSIYEDKPQGELITTATTNRVGVANFNLPYGLYDIRVTATGWTQTDPTNWDFNQDALTYNVYLHSNE